jgi:hypothetical protein
LNFHEGEDATLDDDNMVKPIRDAMTGLVYEDDSRIRYSETIHFGIDAPIKIPGPAHINVVGESGLP